MSAANALVASPVDTTSAISGAYLLQDADDLARAIASGDWGAGALATASTALDTAAAVIDPLGTLIANGLGWLFDHMEPLKGWLNDFTGDPAEVAAFAQTWANVSSHMHGLSRDLDRGLGDIDELSGEAVDAYIQHGSGMVAQLAASGDWANAMSSGLQLASTLVQMVHDIVRDAVSQVVGTALSALALTAVTVGTGAGFAAAQVGLRAASLGSRISRILKQVVDALGELKLLLTRLSGSVEDSVAHLAGLLRGKPTAPHVDAPRVSPQTGEMPDGWKPLSREDIAALPIVRDGSHLNPNRTLKPNTWYQSGEHEYIYHTDENGYIDRFYAENLQLKDHVGRLPHDRDTPGKGPNDHAGHLAGDWAGGSPKLDNLVSMLDEINMRDYAGLEREWRSVLSRIPPGTVSVDIRITTDPLTGRPTGFIVVDEMDGRIRTTELTQ